MSETTYVDGVFIEQREGTYGPYLSIGITEEGLQNIMNLAVSEKGFRNMVASPKRNNPEKYSVRPYIPKPKNDKPKGNYQAKGKPSPKQQEEPDGGEDDLPF